MVLPVHSSRDVQIVRLGDRVDMAGEMMGRDCHIRPIVEPELEHPFCFEVGDALPRDAHSAGIGRIPLQVPDHAVVVFRA